MSAFDKDYRPRFEKLSTTHISDALDSLGLKAGTHGIKPMWEGAKKIVGRAVTMRSTAAGVTKTHKHMGVSAIDIAEKGDVLVVDNGGRLDVNGWGGVLATGAKMKGISGAVVDGACRDIEEYIELDFPVYAKGNLTSTARGRIIEDATNIMVQFQGIQVRPGDVVMADRSGVVIIPQERLDDVLAAAERIYDKEEKMIADLKAGMSMVDVDKKYSYESMLNQK